MPREAGDTRSQGFDIAAGNGLSRKDNVGIQAPRWPRISCHDQRTWRLHLSTPRTRELKRGK